MRDAKLFRTEFVIINNKDIPFKFFEESLMKYTNKWLFSEAKAHGISLSEYLQTYKESMYKEIIGAYELSL